jgi:hypothetical protein
VAGFAVLYAIRWFVPHTVPPIVLNNLKFRLSNDYAPPGSVPVSNRAAFAAAENLRKQVTIERVTAKGLLWGKYLRVEVSIAGATPPDGRRVRYFTADPISGYVTHEPSARKFYLALW